MHIATTNGGGAVVAGSGHLDSSFGSILAGTCKFDESLKMVVDADLDRRAKSNPRHNLDLEVKDCLGWPADAASPPESISLRVWQLVSQPLVTVCAMGSPKQKTRIGNLKPFLLVLLVTLVLAVSSPHFRHFDSVMAPVKSSTFNCFCLLKVLLTVGSPQHQIDLITLGDGRALGKERLVDVA